MRSAARRPSSSTAASAAAPTSSRPLHSGRSASSWAGPYCYGLALNGEQGVRDVLVNFIADLDLTLGLAGCTSFAEAHRENLVELKGA